MIFDAKYLCQFWYKHKILYSKSCGHDFFSVSCSEVLISSLYPLDDPMETEPFKDSGHGLDTLACASSFSSTQHPAPAVPYDLRISIPPYQKGTHQSLPEHKRSDLRVRFIMQKIIQRMVIHP